MENFLYVTDHDLSQFKLYRFILGGLWALVDNAWIQVHVLSYCKDGTRILWWSNRDGQSVSFHEHHCSVKALEDHQ